MDTIDCITRPRRIFWWFFEVRRAWPKNLPLLLRQSLRKIQLLSKAGKLRLNLVHMRSISSFTWQYTRDVEWEHWTWGMRRVMDLASLEDMMPDASPATCWFHHFHHCLLWPGTWTLQEPTTLGAKICVTATMDVSKSGCTGCIRGNMFLNLQTTCRPARHFYTFFIIFPFLFYTSWCTASYFMASALFWSTTANLCNSCDHHSPGAPRTGQTFPPDWDGSFVMLTSMGMIGIYNKFFAHLEDKTLNQSY